MHAILPESLVTCLCLLHPNWDHFQSPGPYGPSELPCRGGLNLWMTPILCSEPLSAQTCHSILPTLLHLTCDNPGTLGGSLLSQFQMGSGAETSPTFNVLPNHVGCF